MAGDWIPLRVDLADDPAVILIADRIGLQEDTVVGKLHRLWAWANRQLSNGHAASVTKMWLDRYLSSSGFADAMIETGWLIEKNGAVSFSKFDRWNSQGAKRRLNAAKRQKNKRVNSHTRVTRMSRSERDENVTREEKRRELNTPPNPQGVESESSDSDPPSKAPKIRKPKPAADPRFAVFWSDYPRKVARRAAEKAFARLDPSDELLAVVLAALARQKAALWLEKESQFIPYPASWLNGRRWEDETTATRAPPPVEPTKMPTAEEVVSIMTNWRPPTHAAAS